MIHEIDISTYKVFREAGIDPDYLMGEDYEIAEWEKVDLLKKGFPVDREITILTNGRHAVKAENSVSASRTTSYTLESLLDAAMKLKAADPDLPIYDVHNHPNAKYIVGESATEDTLEIQRVLGSVPSRADIDAWDYMHNIVGAAIYHQDSNEMRIWKDGDERIRVGTRLAIEYELRKFDDVGFKLDVPEKIPTNIHWATEDENEPNTEYIQPSEWQEKKGEWIDKLSLKHTAAPWVR